jgi:4-carboxymuconolactone decarboxylase
MSMLPTDIDAVSRCRLPPVRREDLTPAAAKTFDSYANPEAGTIRGLHGPGGIRLHSPRLTELSRPVNRYLRFEADLTTRQREIAILTTARECDSQFEWAAHEPEALSCGVPQHTIDAIKFRRTLEGVDKEDSTIIQLSREIFGAREVSSATYAAAARAFNSRQLVDLVSLMGNYAATSALLCAFDMQLDEGETVILPKGI